MIKILLVEDDPGIKTAVEEHLRESGFEVVSVADGKRALDAASKKSFDLLLLDIMLPGLSGIEICKSLRQNSINVPVIMVTSRKQELDKVLGLEIGADDYITKPFSLRELEARIKAVLRRVTHDVEAGMPDVLTAGGFKLDRKKQQLFKHKKRIPIGAREYKILEYFMRHEDEIITRDMLLNDVWGYDQTPTTRTVDNYILTLRKKIETDPASPKHILTVHTSGYKFIR
jgi:DNA-binding response OmpR family regulator